MKVIIQKDDGSQMDLVEIDEESLARHVSRNSEYQVKVDTYEVEQSATRPLLDRVNAALNFCLIAGFLSKEQREASRYR